MPAAALARDFSVAAVPEFGLASRSRAIVRAAMIENGASIEGISEFVDSLSGESGSWLRVLLGTCIMLTIGGLPI